MGELQVYKKNAYCCYLFLSIPTYFSFLVSLIFKDRKQSLPRADFFSGLDILKIILIVKVSFRGWDQGGIPMKEPGLKINKRP